MSDIEKAEHFLLTCIQNGLAHSFDTVTKTWVKPYPEVTGYLLSYFANTGKLPKKIIDAANKLVSLQHPTGGFPSFYNQKTLYTFDTAQIAHGLLSIYKKTKNIKYLRAATRAGLFLLTMENGDGTTFPMYIQNGQYKYVEKLQKNGENWGSHFSPIQLKNAEALLLLSEITKDAQYENAAKAMMKWGKKHADFRFSHPFGYFLEGMNALGEHEYVKEQLKKYYVPREVRGFIPYFPHSSYAYTSGSIQIGILFAKNGFIKESKRILNWASKLQKCYTLGGLFQYATHDAKPDSTVHLELNSWGTKYFAQLAHLHKKI